MEELNRSAATALVVKHVKFPVSMAAIPAKMLLVRYGLGDSAPHQCGDVLLFQTCPDRA
jgi:hypothetical protein